MKLEGYIAPAEEQLQLVSCQHIANKDGAGYAKNDLVKKTWVQNLATNTVVAGTESYINLSQGGATIAAAPPAADLGESITDAILGDEVVVVGAVAGGLTAPAAARHAIVHVWDADIVFTTSGTAPLTTAGGGYRQANYQTFELDSPEEIAAFSAIRLGAADATLYVEYHCSEDSSNDLN